VSEYQHYQDKIHGILVATGIEPEASTEHLLLCYLKETGKLNTPIWVEITTAYEAMQWTLNRTRALLNAMKAEPEDTGEESPGTVQFGHEDREVEEY
jgi:hypothetical protein